MGFNLTQLFLFSCVAIPEFVSTPTSVNVTFGSTVTFSCSVIAGMVTWEVNGSQLSELNAPDISETLAPRNTFSLHIPATEEYNNTVVVCSVALIRGENLRSDPAVLRVQGESYICTLTVEG